MACHICDTERAEYRPECRQVLCVACHENTAPKVGREEFERVYWQGKAEEVPYGIRREFYADYLVSTCDLQGYIVSTTSDA